MLYNTNLKNYHCSVNISQELQGTRRRGRPRKGLKGEVERDLQVLGVRRWTVGGR